MRKTILEILIKLRHDYMEKYNHMPTACLIPESLKPRLTDELDQETRQADCVPATMAGMHIIWTCHGTDVAVCQLLEATTI